jgi:putative ABC transport system ATP-binding protein
MLKQRIMTALVLLAIIVPAITGAPPWVWGLISLLMLSIAGREWGRLLGSSLGSWLLCAVLATCGAVYLFWRTTTGAGALPGGVALLSAASLAFWLSIGLGTLVRGHPIGSGWAAGLLVLSACWVALFELRLLGAAMLVSAMASNRAKTAISSAIFLFEPSIWPWPPVMKRSSNQGTVQTVLPHLAPFDKPSEGKVYIDEVDIAQLDAYELAWMRCRKIGYIFQTFNLIPVMTALENVMLPMVFAGMNTADAQDKARDILTRVELGHRLKNKPSEMSGGQQQRVAIARAFANDPANILADEPTGNLDLNTGTLIIKLLRDLNKEKGVTIISATHDHKMLAVSDRIIWIRDGKCDKIQNREDLKIEVGTIEGAGEEAH